MDGTTQNDAAEVAHLDVKDAGGEPVADTPRPTATLEAHIPALTNGPAGGADGDAPMRIENIDVLRIMDAIPHRYPFLMIDRMVEIVLNQSAVGIKNVTFNEPHFQGHFPSRPVMPGVLIIEAMAQTAAALVVLSLGEIFEGKLVYFMTIDNAKFRRPVVPGDQLRIHVDKERSRGNVWKFRGVARVDGVSVAEATFSAMIMR